MGNSPPDAPFDVSADGRNAGRTWRLDAPTLLE